MAITNLLEAQDAQSEASMHQVSKTKIIFIVALFIVSLALFVFQTEFTSQAYKLKFLEPVVLLVVTHGSWWLLWPLQVIFVSMWRTFSKMRKADKQATIVSSGSGIQYQRLSSTSGLLGGEEGEAIQVPLEHIDYYSYFKKCIVKQFHNVYHTSILIYQANVKGDRSTTHLNLIIDESPHISSSSSITACIKTFAATPSIRYVLLKALLVTIVLTVAGFTWYGAMSMTYAADVTAIYNCSAFTAYAFAIPLLHEKFSWLKASSVIIAISGVFVVAYSGDGSEESKSEEENPYPYRFWGNLIILIGAVLYGYYEVLYKKYLCIPPHLSKIITPRRQLTFANFVMGFFGFYTFSILLFGIILVEVFHIHHFNLFDYGENTRTIWLYISGSILSNLLFSASFLSLMALTSPVLSSVSSLLTIFLIGLVEWWIFGNKLGFQQLVGDFLVIVGFVMLTIASWKEISEGNEDDEVEAVSTYSFALSTEDNR
ncbi:hypothetical protein Cantr_10312 [Candida viswanathii]|uniref:EamA domain-containing protein n=1 Tax=Candida viswanathii TaxID=5486 RepID=A0A367YD41_9ASCO|nr:hypothetical protein Cantr_10312 [Candida viswanathii]